MEFFKGLDSLLKGIIGKNINEWVLQILTK